jgi:hypothetical protein
MKTTMTLRLAVLVGAAIAIASPAGARQIAPRAEEPDPAKAQVQTFEVILRTAVDTGTRNFALRAADMVPVTFSVADMPVVNGVAVRGDRSTEFVFHIQVPGLWPAIQVMNLMMNRGFGGQSAGPQQPVSGGVQADGGLVVADPMGPPAVAEPSRPDLEREYAVSIREALVDAMLDNSGGLPLAESDTLLVIASAADASIPASLYESAPRKLIMTVQASDLIDFRQGRVSREDAKRRIRIASF